MAAKVKREFWRVIESFAPVAMFYGMVPYDNDNDE